MSILNAINFVKTGKMSYVAGEVGQIYDSIKTLKFDYKDFSSGGNTSNGSGSSSGNQVGNESSGSSQIKYEWKEKCTTSQNSDREAEQQAFLAAKNHITLDCGIPMPFAGPSEDCPTHQQLVDLYFEEFKRPN